MSNIVDESVLQSLPEYQKLLDTIREQQAAIQARGGQAAGGTKQADEKADLLRALYIYASFPVFRLLPECCLILQAYRKLQQAFRQRFGQELELSETEDYVPIWIVKGTKAKEEEQDE